MEVLGDRGGLAVRHAVLAQIARAEPVVTTFSAPPSVSEPDGGGPPRWPRPPPPGAIGPVLLPICARTGFWLPPGGRCHSAREKPCQVGSPLGALRGAEARAAASACRRRTRSCSVSSSAHVMCKPPGLAHEAADAERFALQAGRVVGCEIPLVRDAPPFGVQRQALEIALARRRHAMPPILVDDGDPIAREVDGRRAARRLRRRARALRGRRLACADRGDERGDRGDAARIIGRPSL